MDALDTGWDGLVDADRALRGFARRLVAGADEDVAQEAWLAAVRRPGGAEAAPRSWLAAVARKLAARFHRDRARRARREEGAARPEAAPADAFAAKEQARRRIVDLVLALPEPHRTAIVLRHLEGLPPRVIAARLGVPVETVRTRVRKGIDLLRERIGVKGEEPFATALSAWLLPVSGAWAIGDHVAATAAMGKAMFVAAAPSLGGLAMTAKTKFGIAAAIVLVAMAVVWSWPPRTDGPSGGPVVMERLGASAATPKLPDVRESRPVAKDAPVTVTPFKDDTPTTVPTVVMAATLRIRATWESDKSPAAGVVVRVRYLGADYDRYGGPTAVLDSEGVATLASLKPGKVAVEAERNNRYDQRATLVAGSTSEVTLAIPKGLGVKGVVLSAKGEPVAGADIWCGIYNQFVGPPSTRSSADGTFALRDLGQYERIAARAPGHGPSRTQWFITEVADAISVKLILGSAGASVAGRVVGVDGAGVPGATVTFGVFAYQQQQDADRGTTEPPPATVATTDSEGAFRLDSVTPGPNPVQVTKPGFAMTRDVVDVRADDVAQPVLRLVSGGAIAGSVLKPDGTPAAKARVVVGLEREVELSARTDESGHFTVGDVPAGVVPIRVDVESVGRATAKVTVVAGATATWDATLAVAPTIRGRVVDEVGKPYPKAWIGADRLGPALDGEEHAFGGTATADEQGVFEVKDLARAKFRLRVMVKGDDDRSREAAIREVNAPAADVSIVIPRADVPSAYITATVVGPDGAPAAVNMLAMIPDSGGTPYVPSDPTTGVIKAGPLRGGTYTVQFLGRGFATIEIPHVIVEPRGTVDLGRIVMVVPGTIVATCAGLGRSQNRDSAVAYPEGSNPGPHRESLTFTDGVARASVAPGRWRVVLETDAGFAEDVIVDVVAGQESKAAFEVRPAARLRFEVKPAASSELDRAQVEVLDSSGTVRLRRPLWRPAGEPFNWFTRLLPGHYVVRFTAADKTHAEREIDVGTRDVNDPITVELH